MKIRRAELRDTEQISALLRSTKELQATFDPEDSIYSDEFAEDCIQDNQRNFVLVAEENGILEGILLAEIWSKKRYSFLLDLVIAPSSRGKGLGKKLYSAYEEYCKSINIKRIIGLVQIENINMHLFCKKVGLKQGRQLYYYQKEVESLF